MTARGIHLTGNGYQCEGEPEEAVLHVLRDSGAVVKF
jgi:hypothetical protein